jgi:hypothetical protein
MATPSADNLELLLGRLPADSLAARLLVAYRARSIDAREDSMRAIVSERLQEVTQDLDDAQT